MHMSVRMYTRRTIMHWIKWQLVEIVFNRSRGIRLAYSLGYLLGPLHVKPAAAMIHAYYALTHAPLSEDY